MSNGIDFAQYQSDALRTEKVVDQLMGDPIFTSSAMDVLIAAAELADLVKKRLIYGREVTEQQFLDAISKITGRAYEAEDAVVDSEPSKLGYPPRLMHAALGAFGEAGELLLSMQSAVDNDSDVDGVNVVEEAGDLMWYQALLLDEIARGIGMRPQSVLDANISKLKVRFPKAFSLEHSNNRDLDAELAALQAGSLSKEVSA